jgi:hypothetical protein
MLMTSPSLARNRCLPAGVPTFGDSATSCCSMRARWRSISKACGGSVAPGFESRRRADGRGCRRGRDRGCATWADNASGGFFVPDGGTLVSFI